MSLGLAECAAGARRARRSRRRSRTRRRGEAKRGSRRRCACVSFSRYEHVGEARRGSRRGARSRAGPAPMISTSSVCASFGYSASATRNARIPLAHALDGVVAGVARRPRPCAQQDLGSGLVEEREDALLLVGEVLVERRLRHAGRAADRLGARVGVAGRGEHGGGRLEQALALTRGAPRAAARGGRAGPRGGWGSDPGWPSRRSTVSVTLSP